MIESCGHKSPEWWFFASTYSWKSFSRECNNAVDFGSLCPECYALHRKFGLLLNTETEETQWLGGKLPYETCPYCGYEIEMDGWDEWKCKHCGCGESKGITIIVKPKEWR